MSYNMTIFHPSVKQKVEAGLGLDDFEHRPIEETELQAFIDRLQRYGYQPEAKTAVRRGFIKYVEGCPIQVGIYDTEISFSVPYGKKCEGAIFEALQDASELCDTGNLALYNAQL